MIETKTGGAATAGSDTGVATARPDQAVREGPAKRELVLRAELDIDIGDGCVRPRVPTSGCRQDVALKSAGVVVGHGARVAAR